MYTRGVIRDLRNLVQGVTIRSLVTGLMGLIMKEICGKERM